MKNVKRILATIMAVLVVAGMPMQTKAAEVAQPAQTEDEIHFVELKEAYYKEIQKDGVANRHDEDGNLISSTKVENALFIVNSTLTSGWGQLTMDNNLVKGTFKDATLDTKSYLRCSFTTEAGVVYDEVIVKVKYTTYEEEARKQAIAQAESNQTNHSSSHSSNGNSGNGDGNNSGNGNGSNDNNSGSSNGGGATPPGNVGWIDTTSNGGGATAPGFVGWF